MIPFTQSVRRMSVREFRRRLAFAFKDGTPVLVGNNYETRAVLFPLLAYHRWDKKARKNAAAALRKQVAFVAKHLP
jgi:hypothetical protein